MSKLTRGFLFVLLMTGGLACSQQTKEDGPAVDNSITVPDLVLVPQGGRGYMSVSVDRNFFAGTVILEVKELPNGLKVIDESKVVLKPKEASHTFLLLADQSLEAKKGYQAKVSATEEQNEQRTEFDGDILLEFRGLKPTKPDGKKSSKVIVTRPDGNPEHVNLPAKKTFKIDTDNAHIIIVTEKKIEKEKAVNLEVRDYTVRGFGLVVMLVSVVSVLCLVTFCLYRVMSLPPTEEESLKGPLEIDTGDTKNAD